MNILFVASEAAPLAKTGGLADVVGSLPKELKHRGHDVRIALPWYRNLAATGPIDRPGIETDIDCGGRRDRVTLGVTTLGDLPVYLVGHPYSFDREHLYGTPLGDYPDNHRRFALFCRAILSFAEKLDFRPDIIHCHDWQTALIPLLLTHEKERYPFYDHSAVIYTIHNLAYQGLFPRHALTGMGLDPRLFSLDLLEFYGSANLMKGAILTADRITTVSPTYREEILTVEEGCGLEGVLGQRRNDLFGILNGLDYGEWNPATDPRIVRSFSAAAPNAKKENKRHLQRSLGLAVEDRVPLFGVISRLVEQKGVDLVAELLPDLVDAPLQLCILGTGEEKYLRLFESFRDRKPSNISITLSFASSLAPSIYAGCDLFLMPSRFEPCGLGQLIALRYGTVPVVRKTGGLADTVIDPANEPQRATGFAFTDYSGPALRGAIDRALMAYADTSSWGELVRRGMESDFSWERSAGGYEDLYRQAVAERKRPR